MQRSVLRGPCCACSMRKARCVLLYATDVYARAVNNGIEDTSSVLCVRCDCDELLLLTPQKSRGFFDKREKQEISRLQIDRRSLTA